MFGYVIKMQHEWGQIFSRTVFLDIYKQMWKNRKYFESKENLIK